MNKLRYLRLKHGLKQKDLAKLLHITEANYSMFETGTVQINLDYIKTLSGFYHIRLSYLIDQNDEISISKEDAKHIEGASEAITKIKEDLNHI